jgi:phosphotransferase system enzyme I (PtsI)
VTVLEPESVRSRHVGTVVEEARALRQAVAASLIEVKSVADRAGGKAAEMLAFQVEMLADDELAGSALLAVGRGAAAHTAWIDAMGAEIESYRTSSDEYFSARAADLQDIRDRVLTHLTPPHALPDIDVGPAVTIPPGTIVVAEELTLSRFLAIDWAPNGAIVLTQGSPTGHVAMLARSRDVPMVVGLGGAPTAFAGQIVLVDAAAGEVVINPSQIVRAKHLARSRKRAAHEADLSGWRQREAVTADGTHVALHLNIANVAELNRLSPGRYDGIGPVRTDWLFPDMTTMPDEAAQYAVYRQILEWADDRPVTFRAFEGNPELFIPGLARESESNPSLGLRGIRLLLRCPEILRTQFRALARAAVYGTARVALPTVTIPSELDAGRTILRAVMSRLAQEGVTARCPALGIMVEVPATAIEIDRFDAEFFSICLDELTRHVTAAARENRAVSDLADPLNPAVLRLVTAIAQHGDAVAREVSVCGETIPAMAGALLHAGLRSLSVAPAALLQTKQAIARVNLRA